MIIDDVSHENYILFQTVCDYPLSMYKDNLLDDEDDDLDIMEVYRVHSFADVEERSIKPVWMRDNKWKCPNYHVFRLWQK